MKSQPCPTLGEVAEHDIQSLTPAPENDQLYRAICWDDPEIQLLADSIGKRGVLEPLVISEDAYILSGHRRHVAAQIAGLSSVPCRDVPVHRDRDRDEFLRLLREFNRQRVKSYDETVREEVLDINPRMAYLRLRMHRAAKSAVTHAKLSMGAKRRRKKISSAKKPMLDAIIKIVNSLRADWPISERKIHYKLLNNPPLKHASKPDSRYRNDKKSNKSLSDLVTRARTEGLIPMEAIGDETRPVVLWNTHLSVAPFVREEFSGFLTRYWRDLQQSQPNHIELLIEKNTVAGDLHAIASRYCIPMTSGRGYASLPPRYDMAQRFEQSGKDKLIIIIVSDHDPDGERIAESFARSMRDDFDLDVHPIKATLTHQQVMDFGLQFGMDPNEKKSVNKAWFFETYGPDALAYEVDALDKSQLQTVVENVILSVMDVDAYNREVEAEQQDAAYIEALRTKVLASIGDLEVND